MSNLLVFGVGNISTAAISWDGARRQDADAVYLERAGVNILIAGS